MSRSSFVLTEQAVKRHAKRLQQKLLEREVDLSLMQSQECFSQILGFKSFHDLKKMLASDLTQASPQPSLRLLKNEKVLVDFLTKAEQKWGWLFLTPNGIAHGFVHNNTDHTTCVVEQVLNKRQVGLIQDYLFSKVNTQEWEDLCVNDHVYLLMEQKINENLIRCFTVQLYKKDEKDKSNTVIKFILHYKSVKDNFHFLHSFCHIKDLF